MKIGIIIDNDGSIAAVRSDDPTVQVTVCHEQYKDAGDAIYRKAWERDYDSIHKLMYEVW